MAQGCNFTWRLNQEGCWVRPARATGRCCLKKGSVLVTPCSFLLWCCVTGTVRSTHSSPWIGNPVDSSEDSTKYNLVSQWVYRSVGEGWQTGAEMTQVPKILVLHCLCDGGGVSSLPCHIPQFTGPRGLVFALHYLSLWLLSLTALLSVCMHCSLKVVIE